MDLVHTPTARFNNSRPTIWMWGVLLLALAVCGCSGDPAKSFTITVDHVFFDLGWAETHTGEPTDYSSATISLNRIDLKQSIENVSSELSTSRFRDGKVVFGGQIERPMWVEIVVESDESQNPIVARAFVEPGERVSLSLIDFSSPLLNDTIAHNGILSNIQNPDKKFAVSGDFSSLNDGFSKALASISVKGWTKDGVPKMREIGNVLLSNGAFDLEMEFEDPVLVSVSIYTEFESYFWAEIVAERGVSILVQPQSGVAHASPTLATGWFQTTQDDPQRQSGSELVVVAGNGRHAKLIESWEQSYTYRLIREELEEAWEDHLAQRLELRSNRERLDETGDSDGAEETLNSPGVSWINIEPTEGCEHIDFSRVILPRHLEEHDIGSRYEELRDELYSLRRNVLDDFARHAADPMDSILALELGALSSTQERTEKLQTYKRLAQRVSQEVAEERIDPALKRLTAEIESAESENRMVPGQKVPDFELPDLSGTSVNFYQVLSESNLVHLEFVRAHWGADYIARDLGELHTTYEAAGFQIVEVLIGSDQERTAGSSEQDNNAWIKLRESKAIAASSLARSYGTVDEWKNYLIDSKGCIVQSNLSRQAMNEFLSSHFNVASSN